MKGSEKKYATAVILSGIFGIIGIHHFYVGRIGMGIFDLGLLILSMTLIFMGYPMFGYLFLMIDIFHTVIVTYQLLTGQYKDGEGNLILYPGQTI